MPRMTITLSEERHRALKEAAARRGMTITAVIDESLEIAGVRTERVGLRILAKARANAQLSDGEAMELALQEVAAERARP